MRCSASLQPPIKLSRAGSAQVRGVPSGPPYTASHVTGHRTCARSAGSERLASTRSDTDSLAGANAGIRWSERKGLPPVPQTTDWPNPCPQRSRGRVRLWPGPGQAAAGVTAVVAPAPRPPATIGAPGLVHRGRKTPGRFSVGGRSRCRVAASLGRWGRGDVGKGVRGEWHSLVPSSGTSSGRTHQLREMVKAGHREGWKPGLQTCESRHRAGSRPGRWNSQAGPERK